MGTVFPARDLALSRPVALNIVGEDVGPAMRARLLKEADASARLQHPAIATFYEAGEAAGVAFIAMEYVAGETVRERLGRGPLPVEQVMESTTALLEALNHAHTAGLLHRDSAGRHCEKVTVRLFRRDMLSRCVTSCSRFCSARTSSSPSLPHLRGSRPARSRRTPGRKRFSSRR
jgi:hypothetical protein